MFIVFYKYKHIYAFVYRGILQTSSKAKVDYFFVENAKKNCTIYIDLSVSLI